MPGHHHYDVMHYLLRNVEIDIKTSIINVADVNGNTALHMVISNNRNRGSTPLHAAVMSENYEEFETLVQSCDASELTMQDNDGNTPLHLASSIDSRPTVNELCKSINNLEDFSIKNNQCHTASDIARSKGFVEIVDCIDKRVNEFLLLYKPWRMAGYEYDPWTVSAGHQFSSHGLSNVFHRFGES
jgi:ankyrin repeat protein